MSCAGYAGASNKNVIIALQVETADCIRNMEEIAAIPGVDMLFLGQNDLCMSMGLYEKYEFPHMYTSPELNAATTKLIYNARKNNKILGLFLFGTDRVAEFMDKGFTFISVVRPRLWLRCCLCWHSICFICAYVRHLSAAVTAGSAEAFAMPEADGGRCALFAGERPALRADAVGRAPGRGGDHPSEPLGAPCHRCATRSHHCARVLCS